jgi:hypothetical protein
MDDTLRIAVLNVAPAFVPRMLPWTMAVDANRLESCREPVVRALDSVRVFAVMELVTRDPLAF